MCKGGGVVAEMKPSGVSSSIFSSSVLPLLLLTMEVTGLLSLCPTGNNPLTRRNRVRQMRSGQQTKNTNIKNEGPSSSTSHPSERHIRHLGATKTMNIHMGFMLEIDKTKAPLQEEIWRCGGGGG